MSMWEIIEEGRGGTDGYDYGMRGGNEQDRAYMEGYRRGCREGYEKAMYESRQGNMNERRMPGYFPEYPYMDMRENRDPYSNDYDMGERRRRDSRGRYM